ncbi:MAG: hypothetical protein H0T95_10225 [Chthoniobacterales bacterium]|nr:hypothetical protein [Chthoniobacterales bacterium]
MTHAANGRGDPYFKVRLGTTFTGGDVQTRLFKNLGDVREWIFGDKRQGGTTNGVIGMQAAGGASAFAITPAQISDAAWAFDHLGGTSLRDAVSYYLEHARPKGGLKPLSVVIYEHLESLKKSGAAERYCYAQRISCELLLREIEHDAGEDPQISTITKQDIETVADRQDWKPLNKRNYLRDWAMLFRFAVMQDYRVTNPLDKIVRPRVPRKYPEIYTVDEAAMLLRTARDVFPPVLPFVAIGLFAGVRVEELRRMTWEMVDDETIDLPSSVTKKGAEPRSIPIAPNLLEWLKVCRAGRGPVVPDPPLRWWTDALYNEVGFRKRNALRHSFASYYLAYSDSPEKTQMALGQQTPSVLFRHYRQVVKPKQAEDYFALTPDAV